MKKLNITGRGPEAIIQDRVMAMLRHKGWFVKSTHGNMYQSGFPDLYACTRRYGARWIEVKNKDKYVFTPAQMEYFPQISAAGIGIWILVDSTEHEYAKLMGPPNWYQYLSCFMR